MIKSVSFPLLTNLTYLMFWLYFPGLFLYNFLVSTGSIGAILPGGGAGFITALTLPVFFMQYLNSKRFTLVFSRLEIIFLSVIIFSLLASGIYLSLGIPKQLTLEMFSRSTGNLLVLLLYFLAAFSLNMNSNIFMNVIVISFLALSALIVFNVNWEYGLLSISAGYANQYNVDENASIATYQFYARLYAPLAILVISVMSSFIKKFLLIILSIICMVFIGARTEMILMILVFPLYYFIMNFAKASKILAMTSLFIISSGFIILFSDIFLDLFSFNNRFSTLYDLSSDGSLNERENALQFSIDEIQESLFFGNYGSYTSYGGLGYYPHNILSAWHNYGILGFTQYLILFCMFLFKTLKISLSRRCNNYSRAGIAMLIFSFIALFVAKECTYPILGFGVGLLSRSNE
jgi:hypothetical protein